MLLTALDRLRMGPGPMTPTASRLIGSAHKAALRLHVRDVLLVGRGIQMVGAHAGWVVAAVDAAALTLVVLGTWLRVRERAGLSALFLFVGGLVPVMFFPQTIIYTAVLLLGALLSFQAPAKGTPRLTSLR